MSSTSNDVKIQATLAQANIQTPNAKYYAKSQRQRIIESIQKLSPDDPDFITLNEIREDNVEYGKYKAFKQAYPGAKTIEDTGLRILWNSENWDKVDGGIKQIHEFETTDPGKRDRYALWATFKSITSGGTISVIATHYTTRSTFNPNHARAKIQSENIKALAGELLPNGPVLIAGDLNYRLGSNYLSKPYSPDTILGQAGFQPAIKQEDGSSVDWILYSKQLTLLNKKVYSLESNKADGLTDHPYAVAKFEGSSSGITNVADSSGCSCQLPTGSITSSTGSNVETILRFFVGKGLTLAAAAGFVGNMKQESGFNPLNVENATQDKEPNKSVNGGGDAKLAKDNGGKMYIPIDGTGFGLVQWTWGGYKAGKTNPDDFDSRQGGLYHFAVERNQDIGDINLQLEYIWKELSSSYKSSTLDKLDGVTDPVEAAIIIEGNYEISGDRDDTVRIVRGGAAKDYYHQYEKKISPGTATAASSGCSDSDSSGVGEANGVTFPLKTTQAAIKKGVDGSHWCFENQSNCHHDYNAADIFAETGTPIIAAKAGKVVSKTTDSCDYYGCNVSVKGDDGLLYYYTHMSEHAIVNVGQKVNAGDRLGSVGTNATAMNTARHLHFDITRGEFRPSCSGAACNDSDFINVQPILIPAFKALPGGTEDV